MVAEETFKKNPMVKNETMHTYYCLKCVEAGAKNAQDYFCADCKDALAAMEWLGGEAFKDLVGSKKKDGYKPDCSNCKDIPVIFNCCWQKKHTYDDNCQEYVFFMKCSDNCPQKQYMLKRIEYVRSEE